MSLNSMNDRVVRFLGGWFAAGALVVLGPRGSLRFWDISVRAQLDKLHEPPRPGCGNGRHIGPVAFSRDSALAAYGDRGTQDGPSSFLRDAFL